MHPTLHRANPHRLPWPPAGALLLTSLLPLATCVDEGEGAESGEPIQVGYVMPFSGSFAEPGIDADRVARLALTHINEAGGVLGRKIEFVSRDSRSSPEGATQGATDLIEQGIQIIYGAASSSSTAALLDATVANGVLVVNGVSASPGLTQDRDNLGLFFRTAATADRAPRRVAHHFHASGHQKIAAVHSDSVFTKLLAESCTSTFAQLPCAVGPCETSLRSYGSDVDLATFDMKSLVDAALAEQPDVLILSGHVDDTVEMLRHVPVDGGFTGPILVGAAMTDARALTLINQALIPRLRIAQNTPLSGPEYDFIIGEYETAFGERPEPGRFPQGYDMVMLLALAIEHAGSSADPLAIRASMYEVANAPGMPIDAHSATQALELVRTGVDIDYQGVSDVEFDGLGDVAATATDLLGFLPDGSVYVIHSLD